MRAMTVDCLCAELRHGDAAVSRHGDQTKAENFVKNEAENGAGLAVDGGVERKTDGGEKRLGEDAEQHASLADNINNNRSPKSDAHLPPDQSNHAEQEEKSSTSNSTNGFDGDDVTDDCVLFVIVLRNLQPAGFWTPGQLQLPEEALFAGVRQLARLAATSNAWLRHHNLHRLPYLMTTPVPADHIVSDFIRLGVTKLEPALKQRGCLGLLTKLQNMQEQSVRLISDHLKPPMPELRVITHGDFRGGNFLLRNAADGSWEVRVVDWQASMLSHPSVDLVYLLMLSIPREVMKRVESHVLGLYCEAFRAASEALGEPCLLEEATLVEQFRRAKLLGLMWCLSCVTFWDRVKGWPEHCTDIALEVEALGLLDSI